MKNNVNRELNDIARDFQASQMRANELYNVIGRTYFDKAKGNPDEEFMQLFSELEAILRQQEQMETRRKFLNGIVVCTNCKADNTVELSFCASCGTRLPHKMAPVDDGRVRCVNCGNILQPGQAFCGNCGTKAPTLEAAHAPAVSAPVIAPVEPVAPVVAPVEPVAPVVAPVEPVAPVVAPVEPVAPVATPIEESEPPVETAVVEPVVAPVAERTVEVVSEETIAVESPSEVVTEQAVEEATTAEVVEEIAATETPVAEAPKEEFYSSPEEFKIFCGNCGTMITNPEAAFCPNCGNKIVK